MRILNTGVGYAVAGYDQAARRLVIVAVNTGAAQTLTFDLSAFSQVTGGANGVVPRWSTVPAGTDRYAQRMDIRLTGKSVSVPFPAGSVQTLQVDNVTA
jgi:galactan endo-1,6-beta-galactosidase